MITLYTERLFLRPLTTGDTTLFFLLNEDQDVVKYTGDSAFENTDAAAAFLQSYLKVNHYGFGRLAVLRKHDNEFLGWCGLKYSPESNEYDIGFRFFKKYWHQGYATEAARVCLQHGFAAGVPTIIGRAAKANTASIKVLKKLGMVFLREVDLHGMAGAVYTLDNPTPDPPAPGR